VVLSREEKGQRMETSSGGAAQATDVDPGVVVAGATPTRVHLGGGERVGRPPVQAVLSPEALGDGGHAVAVGEIDRGDDVDLTERARDADRVTRADAEAGGVAGRQGEATGAGRLPLEARRADRGRTSGRDQV
jgi:hypothetical protein